MQPIDVSFQYILIFIFQQFVYVANGGRNVNIAPPTNLRELHRRWYIARSQSTAQSHRETHQM
jgi:hypothetical protein